MRSPRRLVAAVATDPDLPLRQGRYRSQLRDERVAALLGAALGVLFSTCFITGLYSHIHQHPLTWLPVPARPAGLYRITQGIHVASGIASLPVLLAKLWVVWPRLVSWPPFRRVGDSVERLGIFALVAGGIFMVFSGVANIAQWYPWSFSFTASHYWVAWVTIGGVVAHLGAKWSITRRSLRHPTGPGGAVVVNERGSESGGITRRGFLGTVAAASGLLTVTTAGQTVPGLRRLSLLAPRDPGDRPVNRSARNAGVIERATSPDYRLIVEGNVERPVSLTLADLTTLPASGATLPIACVEGWSYSARWRGIRLRDLLRMAGAPDDAEVFVESLEENSPYRVSFVNRFQARDRDTLLATHLDGQILTLDHGYPVRLIGPGRPGVTQTKWVTKLVVQ